MSMVNSQDEIKGKSLVELAEQLEASIREAVREGKSLYEVEKDTFGRALQIGHAAIEQLLVLQGDGDLGESMVTVEGRRRQRSEEPAQRPLRTVFGEHTIRAYVYAAGAHQAIELRPIDARLRLPSGRCSYFFEEFSQYFCVDQAFGQASQGLAMVLRLMDGQASLWDAADNCLSVPPEDTIDILDILHVSSYIWRAAKVFYPYGERREAFARDRLLRVLRGEGRGVIAGLRQMASKRGLKGKRREEIATVCGYFEKHLERMHYDEYLAAGYPIATGVIEGACRHLVKDRMERSGMRWRLAGAQPMLHVRAVYQSSYWDDFHHDRMAREQHELHPQRALIHNYHPIVLAG